MSGHARLHPRGLVCMRAGHRASRRCARTTRGRVRACRPALRHRERACPCPPRHLHVLPHALARALAHTSRELRQNSARTHARARAHTHTPAVAPRIRSRRRVVARAAQEELQKSCQAHASRSDAGNRLLPREANSPHASHIGRYPRPYCRSHFPQSCPHTCPIALFLPGCV